MPTVSQSQLTFPSGNKPIRLDAYLPETPETNDRTFAAVIALHCSGGGVTGMKELAIMLAEHFPQLLKRWAKLVKVSSPLQDWILRQLVPPDRLKIGSHTH